MRIIEIELKNHIVIGDIHVKTDNEINAFIGVNGSGKSILLSTLQPFGTSDRYSLSYPIIPNKNGYKRIVYNVNGVIYETIHEYIPNKQKHSCKSYLNRIVNDIKEEDSLLDISTDNTPSVSKVTIGDAEEYFSDLGLEYNIDYKDTSHEKATGRRTDLRNFDEDDLKKDDTSIEDNLFDLIDSMYDEKKGE